MAIWTNQDLDILIQFYPTKGLQYCMAKLNRSRDSVSKKAARLNIRSALCNVKKTNLSYSIEIKNMGYENIEPYVNAMTKIKHRHITCGHTWDVSPNRLLAGVQCLYCGNSTKSTQAMYKESYNEFLKDRDIECLDTYIDFNTKLTHRHLLCEYTWETTPNSTFSGSRCPKCAKSGFDPSVLSTLYFVSLTYNNTIYYKIGITNKANIKERFKSDWAKFNMQVLWYKMLPGNEAKKAESSILNKYRDNKVNLNILSSGNTEILDIFISKDGLDQHDI